MKMIQSNLSTSPHLKNLSALEALGTYIFPVLSSNVTIIDKNYKAISYFNAPGAFIIVKRDLISMDRKLYVGIGKTALIVFIVISMSMAFGVTVWLLVSDILVSTSSRIARGGIRPTSVFL